MGIRYLSLSMRRNDEPLLVMARRTQLKGIANNLAQHCVSRNFDCEGYWAIGQLYALALEKEVNLITLDVLGVSILQESSNKRFHSTLNLLLKIFQRAINSNQISMNWLARVEVELVFNAEFEHEYHCWSSVLGGSPFVCRAKIATDLGRSYHSKSGGSVWLHNPAKESRRSL